MILLSSHNVPKGVEEIRFLDYVINNISTVLSRNSAKKAIKKGELLLNGEVVETGRYIMSGQLIEHFQKENNHNAIYKFALPVIFEDDYIAIINKPAGLSVSGNYFKTVQNALPYNLKPSILTDALNVGRPAHRLDNQTSGLLIVAKTQNALINLGKQFENKLVKKTYAAIVLGKPEDSGEININIEEKEAVSKYLRLSSANSIKYEHISLLKLNPLTGRTHQLRIHLSKIGHPILGDKLYTNPELLFKGKGLFLSAIGVEFNHPHTNENLEFNLEIPHKFKAILNREKKRWDLISSSKF